MQLVCQIMAIQLQVFLIFSFLVWKYQYKKVMQMYIDYLKYVITSFQSAIICNDTVTFNSLYNGCYLKSIRLYNKKKLWTITV
jgi:hypothetical protein